MKSQLLVTAVGEDRPGIVARLTEVFAGHGANLEESRMTILGGEFAAIALITLPDSNLSALEKSLGELKKDGITITTKKTTGFKPDRFKDHYACSIDLKGADHEGIVNKVAAVLHDHSINIHSLETEVVPAPITGSPLFSMKAIVQVPSRVKLDELRAKLGEVGTQESVEIKVDAMDQLPANALTR